MTNPLTTREEYFPVHPIPAHKQDELCLLISNGISEEDACAQAVVPYCDFLAAEFTDANFFNKLKSAFTKRADHWAHKVMKDIDETPTKDEAPGKKLQFEKLKWLAKIDNPEKYGEKVTNTMDVTHNINISVKNMSVADAKKILNDDPFSIPLEAEYQRENEKIVEASIIEKPKEYTL
jgi:hypothetical protein